MSTKKDRELASFLYPKASDIVAEGMGARIETSYAYGTAAADSADGTVQVVMDGTVVGEDAAIDVPTAGGIAEGDRVLVSIAGNVPVDAVAASSVDNVAEVANATAQYFWHDTQGAHVSTVEGDATTGSNVLIDSNGMYIRDGSDDLASFTASTIALGNASNDAAVEMCGGLMTIQQTGTGSASGGTIAEADDYLYLESGVSGSGLASVTLGHGTPNGQYSTAMLHVEDPTTANEFEVAMRGADSDALTYDAFLDVRYPYWDGSGQAIGSATVTAEEFALAIRPVKVESYDVTVASTASGNNTADPQVNLMDTNWEPIGVVGWQWPSGTRQNFFNVWNCYISGGVLHVRATNLHSSSAASGTLRVYVLYRHRGNSEA
jgi:hypothetical protein